MGPLTQSRLVAIALGAGALVILSGCGATGARASFLDTGGYVARTDAIPAQSQSEPRPGESYIDKDFGTRIVRLTAAREPGGQDPANGIVPEYSKAQAWNADGSLFLLAGTDGRRQLWDGKTFRFLRYPALPTGDIEPRWSPRNPDRLTYLDGSKIREYRVSANRSRTVARVRGLGQLSSGAEQERSASGRYFAVHGTQHYDATSRFRWTKASVVDLKTGRHGPAKKLLPPGRDDPLDYVAITPDGRNVVVMWGAHGADLYTRSWRLVRRLTTWDEHADFCVASSGERGLVIDRYRPDPNDNVIEFVPLSGAPPRILWKAPRFNFSVHISCRNTALPGWAYISSFWDGLGTRPGPTPYENEIFALRLDSSEADPHIVRLAHTQMTERADYFDEPHATVSQDGRLVLFGSNFGRFAGDEAYDDAYLLDLREPPAGGG